MNGIFEWDAGKARINLRKHGVSFEAAKSDPDAQPRTPDDFTRLRRVPRVKSLRRALALTQVQFSARFNIPVGTLRDWEQGRSEPDQTARAYLTLIAKDPEGVSRILSTGA